MSLESTSETPPNVSIGDLNADGWLDIALTKGPHWPLVDRVLISDGQRSLCCSRSRKSVGSFVLQGIGRTLTATVFSTCDQQ